MPMIPALLLALAIPSTCDGGMVQDVSRYPYRLPDWLWQDERRSYLISPMLRGMFDNLAAEVEQLLKDRKMAEWEEKRLVLSQFISRQFTLRDLLAGSTVIRSNSGGLALGVQVDPSFDAKSRDTILKAVQLFLDFALDEALIRDSFQESVDDPTPVPEPFLHQPTGGIMTDDYGHRVITQDYRETIQYRMRPADVESFRAMLRDALSPKDGDAALLIISRYSGSIWWGGSYFGAYYDVNLRLTREIPQRGFLYMRLNSDKFAPGVAGHDDPKFWASKVAHETLHGIGFVHPRFADPAERDKHHATAKKSFLVSYEKRMLEKLMALPPAPR